MAALLAAFLVGLAAHDLVCIVGKRGSGKSTFAKALIAKNLSEGRRVLAFDPKDEYSRHAPKKKHVDAGPLRDRCTVDELLAHPEWLSAPDLSLAVVSEVSNTDEEGLAEDLEAVTQLVELTGDLVFVLDEVGLYRDAAARTLKVIGTQSRHWGREGTPVVFVAQRMVLIEANARKQCSMLVTGRQDDPEDLDAIEKLVLPPLGEEQAAAFVQTVATLKRPGLVGWREAA
jgi:energy-coupling factor transporter ATP-binding protein EcfA2